MKNKKFKSLDISKEYKLILYLARTNISSEIKLKIFSLLECNIDWYKLLKIAYEHNLTAFLYSQIKSICFEFVPDEIMNYLTEYFYRNLQKNLLFEGELINILRLLESHDIMSIPYKGPVLANDIYGNIALREFVDLDIIIKKSDALKTKGLMLNKGYELVPDLSYVDENSYLTYFNEFRFRNKKGVNVEIHWKVPDNISFSYPIDFGFDNIKKLDNIIINNFPCYTFSPEDLILILSMHSAKHRCRSLLWICDIAELILKYKNLNWTKIMGMANKIGIKRILFINLIMAIDLFGISVPQEIYKSINFDKKAKKIATQFMLNIFSQNEISHDLLKYTILHINMRENINGFKDAFSLATTPTFEEFENFKMHRSLYPIYNLIRPFFLIKRFGFGPYKPIGTNIYAPTPIQVVDRMLNLAKIDHQDVVYDLGCGDGRIVIEAAKKYGSHGVGVDIDPQRIEESQKNARKEGVEHLTHFIQEDALKIDISNATVITLYLMPSFLEKLKKKFIKQLKPNSKIVTHDFKIKGWEPSNVEHVLHDRISTIYLWKI